MATREDQSQALVAHGALLDRIGPARPPAARPGRCRSSRDASRRSRSMARLRAVVTIHPAGLAGTPSTGHRATAVAKASWTASSASADVTERGGPGSPPPCRSSRGRHARPPPGRDGGRRQRPGDVGSVQLRRWVRRRHVAPSGASSERADLDRQRRGAPPPSGPTRGRRRGRRPARCRCRRGAPCPRRRAVGHEDVAVLHPDHGRHVGRVQPAGEHPGAGGVQLVVEHAQVAHDRTRGPRAAAGRRRAA